MTIRIASLMVLPLAAVIASAGNAGAARAAEAPWCAVVGTGTESVYWDCQYQTFEECRPHVLAGNRGWCNPSPYYVPGADAQKRSGKRRVRQG